MNLTPYSLIACLSSIMMSAALCAADLPASPKFQPDPDGGFRFDTGQLQGRLRAFNPESGWTEATDCSVITGFSRKGSGTVAGLGTGRAEPI